MTSPKINIILISGAFLLYTQSLIITLDSTNSHIKQTSKQVQFWLLALGFTLVLGSMFVKGWRVHRLFRYHRKNDKLVKDGNLLSGLIFLIVLDILFLLAWQLSDPVSCKGSLLRCSSTYYSVWLLAMSLFKQISIGACCYIGWSIRHITFPSIDDGRSLLLVSGFTLISTGLVTTVTSLFPDKTFVSLCLSSILCWLTTTVALCANFLPKVCVIYRANGGEPYMTSASKYIKQPVSSDVGQEMLKILGENHQLKQKLEEKESIISHLRRNLPSIEHIDYYSRDNQNSKEGSSITRHTTSTESGQRPRYLESLCCMKPAREDYTSQSNASVKVVDTTLYKDQDDGEKPASLRSIALCEVGNSPMHTSMLAPENGSFAWTTVHSLETNKELDLIYSIADTYHLPSDSDTYSYISNCLKHSGSSNTIDRPKKKQKRLSHLSQCSTITSDQVYPQTVKLTRHSSHSERLYEHRHPKHRRKRTRPVTHLSDCGPNTATTNQNSDHLSYNSIVIL